MSRFKQAGWCAAFVLALGLAGCGGSDAGGSTDPSQGAVKSQADAEAKYKNRQGGPPGSAPAQKP